MHHVGCSSCLTFVVSMLLETVVSVTFVTSEPRGAWRHMCCQERAAASVPCVHEHVSRRIRGRKQVVLLVLKIVPAAIP